MEQDMNENELMGQLASMPEEGGMGGQPMNMGEQGMDLGAAPPGQPGQPPGGPGVDTPQEQQAIELMTQGAQAFREAANIEPSVRYIIDDMLKKAFLAVTKHYGMEQEGKLALQQGELELNKQQTISRAMPPGGGQGGPPMGGPPVGNEPPMM